ncbi:ABC transporter permease [Xanthocytophaga agilis]|uniref:ABC transporter permease n=1 Tax=Xanthocytophaga agilis TaxID=3048010 RepID=A0AAE3UD40_9BACT|nr:ABC transporter permease [Xanthocytophaga agilis]MDJ1500805.1 ABC transporter permease [Xanthocytophaga agilis]
MNNKEKDHFHPPPRWLDWLLERFCAPHLWEEVQGDLHERFYLRIKRTSKTKANWLYFRDSLSYLRPSVFKHHYSPQPSFADMIRNYLTIAWRNLLKNKAFSSINIAGLALGMTCTLLIMFWIQDEYSVDAFHIHKNQLYRIYERQFFSGKAQGVIWTQGPLAEELKKEIPEIEMATAFSWTNYQAFTVGNKTNKQGINTAGPDFFKMFSFPLLQGNVETALKDVNNLAISRKMAEAFFGSPEAAIGKTIRYDNRKNLIITAVFENIPQNSTLQFDCLRSWESYVQDNEWAKGWDSNDPLTFFMLRADADPAKVEAKLKHFTDKYIPDPNKTFRTELGIQPFHEYYLNSNFENAQVAGGRIKYIHLFTIVAVFILLIACINFMNLATARSAKRAKEVGVRKAIGAIRSALTRQFLSEAMLLTILAVGLSLLLVFVLLPFFNSLTNKHMTIPITNISFWGIVAGMTFITGLLAGSYPAFFLSSLNPVNVLKGTLKFTSGSLWFRKGLVVFQFALSTILIIGMIIIYRQIEYVQTKNLGYSRENLIYFPLEGNLDKDYGILKEQLSQISGVKQVSHITESPASLNWGTDGISWPGSDPTNRVRFTPVGVGYDFVETMNLKMKEGRDFSKKFATDSTGFLINESALKAIGYKNPVGKFLNWGNHQGKIIGVIKDFHFQSLHTPIRPLIAYLRNQHREGSIMVRIETGNTQRTLSEIETVCKKLNPEYPFTYYFTDQEYARQYQSEQVISRLSNYFAGLAIFIACLGLFGLASFSAEQRAKEIGIRKIVGASVGQIVLLFSADFLKLIVVAMLIAVPVAWYAVNEWLQGFAYRTEISWWIFVLAGIVTLVITILTISFQSIKAALQNPVKSLRTE